MDYREKIGTKETPLKLKTPPLSSEYTMHVDEKDGMEALGLAEVTHEKRGNKMKAI